MNRFLLASLLLLACGCGRARPSIVLVSIDSLRADDLGRVVSGQPVAPRLTALRDDALYYERATSAAPWTTPSMMAVMTGLAAPAHGVEEHDRALAPSVPTLAERLRAAGYRTAAFVPAVTLRAEYGFARGFEVYDVENYGHTTLSSPALIGKAIHRLEMWKDEPFFVWVHLWDPHYNYNPPTPYDTTFRAGTRPASEDVQCLKWRENAVAPAEALWLRGQHDGEVAFTDRHVGELVDALQRLGLDQRVVVALMADHGEAFQEHGWLGHTNRVDETLVHVPLLLRWPGHVQPGRVAAPVTTAGLGRTLLELVGLDPAGLGSEPVLPRQNETGVVQPLSETLRQGGCFTSLTSGALKLIVDHRTCRAELYDVVADPGETKDLAATDAAAAGRLHAALGKRLADIRAARIPRAAMPPEIVEEAERALRALGYVQGKEPGANDPLQSGCFAAPRTGKVDTFGDTAVAPCPAEGAARCFADPPAKSR